MTEQETTKRCSKCSEMKPLECFPKISKTGKHLSYCKECESKRRAEYRKKRRENNPDELKAKDKQHRQRQKVRGYKRPPRQEYMRNYNRSYWRTVRKFKSYKLTHKVYMDLFEQQHSVCAICGKPETSKHQNGKIRALAIDHDHVTGKIRGLLCFKCNTNLAILENEEFRAAVQAYLAACQSDSEPLVT